MSSAAKMLLNDFQRGKLPHYVKPPGWTEKDDQEIEKEAKEAANKKEVDETTNTNEEG